MTRTRCSVSPRSCSRLPAGQVRRSLPSPRSRVRPVGRHQARRPRSCPLANGRCFQKLPARFDGCHAIGHRGGAHREVRTSDGNRLHRTAVCHDLRVLHNDAAGRGPARSATGEPHCRFLGDQPWGVHDYGRDSAGQMSVADPVKRFENVAPWILLLSGGGGILLAAGIVPGRARADHLHLAVRQVGHQRRLQPREPGWYPNPPPSWHRFPNVVGRLEVDEQLALGRRCSTRKPRGRWRRHWGEGGVDVTELTVAPSEVGGIDLVGRAGNEVPPDNDVLGEWLTADEQNCRCVVRVDREVRRSRVRGYANCPGFTTVRPIATAPSMTISPCSKSGSNGQTVRPFRSSPWIPTVSQSCRDGAATRVD